MKYGMRAVSVHVLITERDDINVSGLAKTLHLLWLIDIVEFVRGQGKLNCLVSYMPLLMI